jgi:hypothetical protein
MQSPAYHLAAVVAASSVLAAMKEHAAICSSRANESIANTVTSRGDVGAEYEALREQHSKRALEEQIFPRVRRSRAGA